MAEIDRDVGPPLRRETAAYRRLKKTEATAILTKLRWPAEEIALVLDLDKRTIRRKRKLCRLTAKAVGRV